MKTFSGLLTVIGGLMLLGVVVVIIAGANAPASSRGLLFASGLASALFAWLFIAAGNSVSQLYKWMERNDKGVPVDVNAPVADKEKKSAHPLFG